MAQQSTVEKTKGSMFRVSPIKLDANGDLPTRILLMQSGHWPNSVKGDFKIRPEDIKEIKTNFDAGIGFPTDDASTGIAIDFKHEYLDAAAAWIKGLQVEDYTDADGNAAVRLYADPVEWTDEGAAAVQNGRFKCISPSGYFGQKGTRMSAWPNPTNLKQTVKNVLDGAGLTNFPFLRGMSPIRASATDDNPEELEYDKLLFVSESQNNEEKTMNVDELRTKDRQALSVPELDFLEEHKTELSAAEITKFKLAAEVDTTKVEMSAEDKELLAAVKDGSKKVVSATETIIEKSTLDGLVASSNRYKEEKVKETLDAHVKRGAIKSDQGGVDGFWGKQLLAAADSEDDSKAVKDALDALPGNEQLAAEIGNSGNTVAGETPRDQLNALAQAKVAEAAKNGKELLYGEALKQVMADPTNKDLLTADASDVKLKAGV